MKKIKCPYCKSDDLALRGNSFRILPPDWKDIYVRKFECNNCHNLFENSQGKNKKGWSNKCGVGNDFVNFEPLLTPKKGKI